MSPESAGVDLVRDFNVGEDRIDATNAFDTEQTGDGLMLLFEGGAKMTLAGVNIQDVQADWFIRPSAPDIAT